MIRRRMGSRDDEGVGLVFVLLVSVMVMLLLSTAITTLIVQIKPAESSVDRGRSVAAAEAGIEDAVGWLNTNCGSPDGLQCDVSTPTNGQQVAKTLGTSGTESFTWTVVKYVAGKIRVSSTGRSLGALVNNSRPVLSSTTLVADILATPSFTNFQYYTKFETFPSDFVNTFYTARNVRITSSSAANGSSVSGPGLLKWNGVCTFVDASTTPNCDPNHSSNVCEDLYYPGNAGPGRSTDTAWNNTSRRPSSSTQNNMGTNPYFAYYAEGGTYAPATGSASSVAHNDTCDSTFEPNMDMNGPIYSQDAYLIDRGKDTGNSKNSMPVFTDPAYSMWDGTTNGVKQAVGPNGGYARAYPGTDGQISTSISPQPVYTTDQLELPANANAAQPLATCTYTGPTRILIKQNYAYVTSPGTPTSPKPTGPAYCYTSTGNFSNTNAATGYGVANAQVPIGSTLIYVSNPNATTHPIATSTTPIFNLATNLTVPGFTTNAPVTPTTGQPASWNTGYTSTSLCGTAPNGGTTPNGGSTRRQFDCEATSNTTTRAADVFQALTNIINAEVADTTVPTVNVSSDLQSKLLGYFPGSAIWSSTAPSSMPANSVAYVASVSAPTATNVTTTLPTAQSDNFYQPSPASGQGQGYKSGTNSWTVAIQRYACGSSACNNSNKVGSPQTILSTTISRTGGWVDDPTAQVNTVSSWPYANTTSNYTDMSNDITPYQTNWGDAYVEGTLTGQMTIVAEHDIVATNDIKYTGTNVNTTTDGLGLVADHNVRVYRPMTCVDNDTTGQTGVLVSNTTGALTSQTDPNAQLLKSGYCPDDLTGVYTTALSWPLPTNYPSTLYKPDSAPSMTNGGSGVIDATVFTLRGCFMIDNWYRGNIGTSVSVVGGLYQYHRGPTSLPYQGRPYQGSGTKMPGVNLSYTYDNMRQNQSLKGGLRVPWVPNPQGRPTSSVRVWNVTAISTGS